MKNDAMKMFRMIVFFCLAVMAAAGGCGSDNGGSTVIMNTANGSPSAADVMSNAGLSYLNVSKGVLSPRFSSGTASYTALFIGTASITVTPVTSAAGAAVLVNNQVVNSGTPSGSIPLHIGRNTVTVTVFAPDGSTTKTYAITAIRLSQEAYAKASNTGANDAFGCSVSLSGDTLAVGADGEDSNATGVTAGPGFAGSDDGLHNSSGAVYVFTRTGTAWTQQAYIKASNTGTGDGFGYSVSLYGDTLAVGAYQESSNATGVTNGPGFAGSDDGSHNYSGAVYVFTRTGTTWTQQAYIKASNTGAGDWFGNSVSLSGDTLAVGAYQEASNATGVNGDGANNGAPNSGAVYVFMRTGGAWSQQAYIKGSNTEAGDYFGQSVSLSGDTLAVGAMWEDSNAAGVTNGTGAAGTDDGTKNLSGAAYVFTRTGGTWTQQAYVKASNPDAGDRFGYSVSLSGDTLAVGAANEDSNSTGGNGIESDNSATNGGAVYVFTRANGAWSQEAYLKASNTSSYDVFGSSVSLSGDVLAVGAYGEDGNATGLNGADNSNANESGAAYVFTRANGIWRQEAYIKASNTGTGDWFGYSVSLSDGTIAAVAVRESSDTMGVNGADNDNATESGAVYVFH